MNRQHGFTLVELSIVIVIIGLMVAGVLAGTTLIRQARINKIVLDVKKYQSAALSFKEKYGTYPGDFSNASAYWSSCVTAGGNTCNGNGNKLVESASLYEDIRFWQHLVLAGMIEGSYTGLLNGTYRHSPGINAPVGPLEQSTYFLSTASAVYGKNGNSMHFAKATFTCNTYANDAIISAQEAYAIDNKVDDGVADKGNIYAAKGHTAACAVYAGCVANTIGTATSGAWDFSVTTPQCRLFFWF